MHLLTFVLIPSSAADIEAEVRSRLEPGPRSFPSYSKACSCVGFIAQSAGFAAFDETERGVELLAARALARHMNQEDTEAALMQERLDAARSIASARAEPGAVAERAEGAPRQVHRADCATGVARHPGAPNPT